VFDLYGNQRLAAWKQFRSTLENSSDPLLEVAEFWANAPFVSSYLNPSDSNQWPDPWHLVLDSALDELAIVLGMLYTIKLTQRFMTSNFEIHMSIDQKETDYYLKIDDVFLDYTTNTLTNNLEKTTSIVWQEKFLQ
jgi:hypothetical protein